MPSLQLTPTDRVAVAPGDWDLAADASDDGWLWHVHALPGALATWQNASDRSFALVAPDGRIAALMPLTVFAARRLRGSVRYSTVLSLGGPASADWLQGSERQRAREAAVAHALEIAEAAAAVSLDVTLAPLAPALRGERSPRVNPLCALGFENTLTQSWLVDLRPGRDLVWRGLRDRARTEIRRAEREGITVRTAGPDDLDAYYALHVATYRRTGAEAHPRAYFERIWADLLPTGRATVFVAEAADEVVAARNFGCYKRAALYWTGAASDRGLAAGAGALLQWHAMEWMLEQSYEWSESGEAFPGTSDPKLQGLSLHKAAFGGELYPLYRGRMRLPHRAYATADALHQLRSALRA